MKIPNDELITVLSQFNPWWRQEAIADLPAWRRAAFQELFNWVTAPPVPRAVLLSGARQVGKTTLLRQIIQELLNKEVPSANILYVTFDHPLIKLAGVEEVLKVWRERNPAAIGPEYLFLDEAQFIPSWGVWIKHQVDFVKNRRIVFTGSAMPLLQEQQESGVGRWHTIRLSTLSFYEYLKLKASLPTATPSQPSLALPALPQLSSLLELFSWPQTEFYRIAELAGNYVGHFHEYLARGGFPQTAAVESIQQAQRLLREDIVDKVLKRDMTALFGVRRILELEQTFLYLCMHDGGLLDMAELCSNLELKRPTVQNFIDLLEATHLIYRLQPFGYGKDVLRAKYKIYLADASIAPAVLLRGPQMLENAEILGVATETAVFKHLFTHYRHQGLRFSYWRNKKDHEVDVIVEGEPQFIIPFEVKYRRQHTGARELSELLDFCEKKALKHAYVITKSITDFGLLKGPNQTAIMRVPAALFCYWLGAME